MVRKRQDHGQAWSMDLIIGVLIFMLAVGVIYSLLGNFNSGQDPERLKIESEVVANIIVDEPSLQVAPNNELNMDTLAALARGTEGDYETLKKRFGIKNEFCIYLQDDEGNLVYILDGTEKYAGIGANSDDITLTDEKIPCGIPCSAGYNCGG